MRVLKCGVLLGAALAGGCVVPSTYRLAAGDAPAAEVDSASEPALEAGFDAEPADGTAEAGADADAQTLDAMDSDVVVAPDAPDVNVLDAVDASEASVDAPISVDVRYTLTATERSAGVPIPTDTTRRGAIAISCPPRPEELELFFSPAIEGVRFTIDGTPVDENVGDLPNDISEVVVQVNTTERVAPGTRRFEIEARAGTTVVARAEVMLNLRARRGALDVSFGDGTGVSSLPLEPAATTQPTLYAGIGAADGQILAGGTDGASTPTALLYGWDRAGLPLATAGWSAQGYRRIPWSMGTVSGPRSQVSLMLPDVLGGSNVMALGVGHFSMPPRMILSPAAALYGSDGSAVGTTQFAQPASVVFDTRLFAASHVGVGTAQAGYLTLVQSAAGAGFLGLGRLRDTGALETSFGTNGYVDLRPMLPSSLTSVSVAAVAANDGPDSTGRILVALNGLTPGSSPPAQRSTAVLLALDRAGRRVDAFTGAWVVGTDLNLSLSTESGPPPGVVQVRPSVDRAGEGMSLQGVVWVPGARAFYAVGTVMSVGARRAAVFRIHETDLNLNESYMARSGASALRVFDCVGLVPTTVVNKVIARRDGQGFVVGGQCFRGLEMGQATLMAFTQDGERDASFYVPDAMGFQRRDLAPGMGSSIDALAIASDGQLLAFTTIRTSPSASRAQPTALRLHLEDPGLF